MILLRNREHASRITDYYPISLIHSFSNNLFTKVLANRLVLVLHELVRSNQSAFIKGQLIIHDNFHVV